ncbi:MAG: hypothetical protein WD737_07050 [Gemmatimonadota bacterium]
MFAALLLLCSASNLRAQAWEDYDYEDLAFRGIGVDGGRVWPAKVEPTYFYGIRTDLGFVGPHVRVHPSARFWSSALRAPEVARLAEQIVLVCERQGDAACPTSLDLGEVRLSDLELAIDAQYLFLGNRVISPYLGLGAGLHLLNGRGDFINDTFVEDLLDTVAPGIGTLLGANVYLGSVQLAAEARLVLASDVRYASLGATGVWTIPTPRGIPDELLGWRR